MLNVPVRDTWACTPQRTARTKEEVRSRPRQRWSDSGEVTADRPPHVAEPTTGFDIEALDLVRSTLAPVAESLRRVAAAFDERRIGPAYRELTYAVQALGSLTVVTAALTRNGAATRNRPVVDALFSRLHATLDVLATERRAQNWDAIASIVEGELLRIVLDWTALFHGMCPQGDAPRRAVQ